jgi:hypothetical protein
MVALLSETLVTLTEASKKLPNRPHASTIWRWYKVGVRGRRLETIVMGGRRLTSLEALSRFAGALTAARDGIPATPPPRTSRQRQAAIRTAEAALDRAGV